jgi:hypothetical protein
MSQPLTVAHRTGQLAYPTWAAHTTNCLDLLVDGAGGPGHEGYDALCTSCTHHPVAYSLDEKSLHLQAKCEHGTTTRHGCLH